MFWGKFLLIQDKVTDKILEIRKFLTKIKYFARLRPPTIKALASKLVVKNFKGGHMLCDQDELCRNLYIIKNGQVALKRVINKQSVDTSNFPQILKEELSKMPDQVEVEVKLKYNSGDILLLNEIQTSASSKYRIRVVLPSQLYVCTYFDLQRHVGIDQFEKVADSDYFTSDDADILKHHVETCLWKQYRSTVVDNHMFEITKKQFYTCSALRSNNQVTLGRTKEVDSRAKRYFKTKQEFFDIDKAQKLPFLSNKSALENKPTGKLTHEGVQAGNLEPELSRASVESLRRSKLPTRLNSIHEADKKMVNEYTNELNDEHLNAIFKYQYKKIVSMAFENHKVKPYAGLGKQQNKFQGSLISAISVNKSPTTTKTIKSFADVGKSRRTHSMSNIAVTKFVINK